MRPRDPDLPEPVLPTAVLPTAVVPAAVGAHQLETRTVTQTRTVTLDHPLTDHHDGEHHDGEHHDGEYRRGGQRTGDASRAALRAAPAPAALGVVARDVLDPALSLLDEAGRCEARIADALAEAGRQVQRAEVAHAHLRGPLLDVGAYGDVLDSPIAYHLRVAWQAVSAALALMRDTAVRRGATPPDVDPDRTEVARVEAELAETRDLARRLQLTLAVACHGHANPRPEVPPRAARIARDVLAATIGDRR